MKKDRAYYLTAVIFFIAAVCIHIMGYFTNYLYAAGWFLWIPAFLLAAAAVVRIIKDRYILNPYINRKKIVFSTQFIILIITAVYVVFNVVFNCYILRNGGGEFKDGVYYLINLGERIREISEAEYGRLLLAEYRMFTGHILLLYALVVMYFKAKLMEYEEV